MHPIATQWAEFCRPPIVRSAGVCRAAHGGGATKWGHCARKKWDPYRCDKMLMQISCEKTRRICLHADRHMRVGLRQNSRHRRWEGFNAQRCWNLKTLGSPGVATPGLVASGLLAAGAPTSVEFHAHTQGCLRFLTGAALLCILATDN